MDAREIPSDSGLVYGITGHGPGDGRDSGMVDGRVLYIDKKSSDTSLRLLYQDNFRVHLSGKACSWEIKVDGKSCSSGVIRGDRHVSGGENTHRFHAIIGYCDNIAAGEHKIQAYVAQAPGYSGSDCYTGWGGGASWTLASEEVALLAAPLAVNTHSPTTEISLLGSPSFGTKLYKTTALTSVHVLASFGSDEQKYCCSGTGTGTNLLDLNNDGNDGLMTSFAGCESKCQETSGCNFFMTNADAAQDWCLGFGSCSSLCTPVPSYGRPYAIYQIVKAGAAG